MQQAIGKNLSEIYITLNTGLFRLIDSSIECFGLFVTSTTTNNTNILRKLNV